MTIFILIIYDFEVYQIFSDEQTKFIHLQPFTSTKLAPRMEKQFPDQIMRIL